MDEQTLPGPFPSSSLFKNSEIELTDLQEISKQRKINIFITRSIHLQVASLTGGILSSVFFVLKSGGVIFDLAAAGDTLEKQLRR